MEKKRPAAVVEVSSSSSSSSSSSDSDSSDSSSESGKFLQCVNYITTLALDIVWVAESSQAA